MEAGPGPRRHLEMGDTGGPSETSGGRGSGNDLPVMPGPEKPLLHTAIEFVETLDNTLAEHQMLNIAHGELPADAACIIDVPIEAVALPDPSHPQYGSALVKRLEIQTKNQSNRVRRLTIVFNSRTKLFGMLVRSAKPKNPGFAQEMLEQCAIDDRSGTAAYGSRHRDGPKGYRMIQLHLTSAKGRSEYDKMYYKIAYELQVKEVLPDGCSSVLYERTVQAFLHYILPNLAQPLDDEDAARHIVNKMPDNLAPDKRRMIEWLQESGRWSERKLIVEKCKSIVDGEQKKTVTKPSFAAIPDYPLNYHDILALQAVAFVEFDLQGTQDRIDLRNALDGEPSLLGAQKQRGIPGGAGNPKNQIVIKYCDGCPHINGRQCYCDPAFTGKMAVAVWLNTERRKKIFEKKAANSKDPEKNPKGVPNGRIQKPSDEEIKQWGEKQKARKGKGSDSKSATPGGAMVPNDFMTRFADLDDPAFGQSILGMAMHQAVVLDEGLQVQKVDHFQLEEQSYAEMVREVIVSGDVDTLRGLLSERMVL